ncbi:MAG: XRE family transcriptional regulator [Bacteroidales bacterium]|jgi:hypothetical protein|nr:XRE family transcriptional regulator [Bacteroidales bacterium]
MEEKIHIGKRIRQRLKEDRRSAAWLAEQLHCDRTNVYKLYGKSHIDVEQLLRISLALRFDFFQCYSDYVQKCCLNGYKE